MSGVISDNTVRSSGQVAPLTSATTDANDPARDTNPTDGLGTKWINTTSGQIFICTDATTDANEWVGQTGTTIQPRIVFMAGYSDMDNEHQFSAPGKVAFGSYANPTTTGDFVDFGSLVAANQYGTATSNGVNDRGVFGGGCTAASCPDNTLQYITFSTTGNAIDYGDLTEARTYAGACSNGTTDRGVFAGGGKGSDVKADRIDYITISSGGTATDQGNLVQPRDYTASLSNGTNDRAINCAGRAGAGGGSDTNDIDYWTISSGTNASDFGNLVNTRSAPSTCSNDTNDRGLFMCGRINGSYGDAIDYITITSTGNASAFGNVNGGDQGYGQGSKRGHAYGTSNGTGERGFNGGGYTSGGGVSNWYKDVSYITISTLGNGQFFGNLTERVYGPFACNNTFG